MRTTPPWTDSNYSAVQRATPLRVAYTDGWYIIQAPGGHIIGSTQDPVALAALIRLESERGQRATEFQLQPTAGACHQLPQPSRRGLAVVSLDDLGL